MSYAVGANPQAVVTADFNGDGQLGPGRRATLDSNASACCWATATARSSRPGPPPPAPARVSLAVGDFNGDGKLDLATANLAGNDVSVLLGNGDGTLPGRQQHRHRFESPQSVAVGDFNGDGKLDLGVTSNVLLPRYGTYDYTVSQRAAGQRRRHLRGAESPPALGDSDADFRRSWPTSTATASDDLVTANRDYGDGQRAAGQRQRQPPAAPRLRHSAHRPRRRWPRATSTATARSTW